MSTHKPHVTIIDYGYGNLHSVENAVRKIILDTAMNMDVLISDKADDIITADRLILPGQGAFGSCMEGLKKNQSAFEALQETVKEKARPFLGICVGMQLLASRGHEFGLTEGLGWIDGDVVPLEPNNKTLKIPHMGWNTLAFDAPGQQDNRHPVLKSVREESYFYFVHSYRFDCKNELNCLASTDYGGRVEAVVGAENFIGVQFHPEKSHDAGLRLIEDFLNWMP